MPIRSPRLLPITILVSAMLFGTKSVQLVQAALADTAAVPTAPGTAPASPPDAPPDAPPDRAQPVANWDSTPPLPPQCRPDPAMIPGDVTVLTALKTRADALDARAAALDKRQALVDAANAALGEKLAALQAVQARLDQVQQALQQNSNDRWNTLVATYSAMAPEDAARIFNGLDMNVLLPVLMRMNNRKAAPILAAMDADKARAATDLLAGQAPELPLASPAPATGAAP